MFTFEEIGALFNRSWLHAFSKKKFLLTLVFMLIASFFFVFCESIALEGSSWVAISFSFLPVFLCAGLFLTLGTLIIRMYFQEIKGVKYKFGDLIKQSVQVAVGLSYLTVPFLLAYVLLWAALGVFYLLREIPMIGDSISVLLVFGPFLLILGALVLSILTLALLFFVTPHVAAKKNLEFGLVDDILDRLKSNPFGNIVLFLIGSFPLVVMSLILFSAMSLTKTNFLTVKAVIGMSMGSMIMMIPISLCLTPFVIFFFHFAVEGFALYQRSKKTGAVKQENKEWSTPS